MGYRMIRCLFFTGELYSVHGSKRIRKVLVSGRKNVKNWCLTLEFGGPGVFMSGHFEDGRASESEVYHFL